MRPVSAGRILLDQLRSMVVLLLVGAAVVALLLGDVLDAAAIAAVLVINTALGFVTEMRARRALEALLRLDVPRAVVVRDGKRQEIDAQELAPGDVIQLEAGQSSPADVRLYSATDLRVNEAALTGESVPVNKSASVELPAETPLPDRTNMVYRSTGIVAGTATGIVVATGMQTEVGRIGGLVGGIADEKTPLERRLDALGRRFAVVALLAGAVVITLGALRGAPLVAMIETGLALAIAAVPEGLPAVATIALAVGMHRMTRRRALMRRLASVETLGSVTVIGADKTGTLTAGELTATHLWIDGDDIEVTGRGYAPEGEFRRGDARIDINQESSLRTLLETCALSSRADIAHENDRWSARGDPTDAALLVAAQKAGLRRDELRVTWPERGELPFSDERLFTATFHEHTRDGVAVMVKGATHAVLALCSTAATRDGDAAALADERKDELGQVNEELAGRGLRVIALARGAVAAAEADAIRDLTFVGFAGMIDDVAAGVRETIARFHDAGIRTVMITGDQRRTAAAIGRDLGIVDSDDAVLDGVELSRLSDGELAQRIGRVTAFSRTSPEAKLRIVTAYQQAGEIVAMLGDGINDAAALKKADVGVAMGGRGSDAAREVAAVVLQDDRFPTIGVAIEEGRVIFDNIRKFVFFLFSCNLAEVMVLLGAGLIGLPQPLMPLQILWLNLVTDTFPALALALEPAEPDLMKRPPRDPQQAILSLPFLRSIAFYALLITVSSLGAFAWATSAGDARRASTIAFMTLALAQTFHLANARSEEAVITPRRAFTNLYAIGALLLVAALQAATILIPPLARVLRVVPLSARDWLIVLALALLPTLIGQALKLLRGWAPAAARS